MADDSSEDPHLSPDPGRARREPPTIDLEASEVTDKPQGPPSEPEPEPEPAAAARPKRASLWPAALIGALSGAVAGALLVAGATFAGWPGTPPEAPAIDRAALDDLGARLGRIEHGTTAKPAPAERDPATIERLDAQEKSLAGLRGELDVLRGRYQTLATDLTSIKAAPSDTAAAAAAPADLSAIDARIAGLEAAVRAQKAEIAPAGAQEAPKPADDMPLRRIVAATLLDVVVRVGDPYPAALTAARSLAPNPDALKPLEPFAASGVPNPANLSRELLNLVPKLSPAPARPDAPSGIVDRLEAGATRLVRIERTDAKGSDTGSVVARVTAAALRNDVNEARRELNTLPAADRAAAQGWIEKADARDAALAASRQFAAEAMTALARPAP